MAKIDRSILQANDQSMGQYGDPDKIESSITHLADKIDENDNGFNSHKDALELAHPDKSVTERKLADGAGSSRVIANSAVKSNHLDPSLLQNLGSSATLAEFDKRGLSPEKYGSKGDNLNDDTLAIQQAIEYALESKLKVKFPPGGTYLISASILIPSGVEVDFNGVTLKRKTGSGVFDLIRNTDTVNGNTGIIIKNLKVDGNKDIDGLVATNGAHRFGGLVLKKVTNSELQNVTVTGTVNAEDTAGIYFEDCSDIEAKNVNGYSNDRTAILLVRSKVRINGSKTYNNLGSGISSTASDESEYHNIVSYDNGYSNVSINGKRSKASNILTYGSAYSGLNIGHNNAGGNSEDSVVSNVHSYNNGYEGITIAGSKGVKVIGFEIHGNSRNNARVYDGATESKLLGGTVRDSAGGQGILYESGSDHLIDSTDIFGNATSGINVGAGVSVKVGDLVNVFNNGKINSVNSAGIILNTAQNCYIGDVNIYDNQAIKTQESGLWIAGGSGHKIKNPTIKDNKTYGYRETNAPSSISYADKFVSLAGAQLNGWSGSSTVKTGYWKDSDGFVHLEGVFSSGTVANAAFNLPAGYRPANNQNFATVANNAFAFCVVASDGNVTLYTSNLNHYVNNVRFKAL